VARLRVECQRLGITDLAVTVPRRGMGSTGGGARAGVKLSPITLPASAEVRLRRLAPGATYQADQHRLLLTVAAPATGSDYAPGLVELLSELVPEA
jgi:transcription-repair coupling factor (superfamily II helicase)